MRLIDLAALAAVVLWACALTFGLPPAPLPTDPLRMADYGLNTRQAEIIAAMVADAARTGRRIVYPDHYAYPPGFVVLMVIWLKLGAWAYPAWLALMIAALAAIQAAGARVAGLGAAPGRLAIATLAVATAAYAVGWDLKTRNVNLIYLAVAMLALAAAERRAAVAGLLLSLSVALKLYSVLFLPWLVWRRRWAWLAWTVAGLALWFVALPTLWFGWQGAWALTLAWLEALRAIGAPAYQDVFPGYLVTLHKAIAWLLSAPADERATVACTIGLQVVWVVFVAWKLWPRDLPFAAEASLILLLPLPLAPLLQPHHTVVFLLPALTVLGDASRPGVPQRQRWQAAATLIGVALLTQVGPAGGWRAMATMFAALGLAKAMGGAQPGPRL